MSAPAMQKIQVTMLSPREINIGQNVRESTDKEALKELTQSIKERGILQPLIVRLVADKYELVAGHRRLSAAVAAKLTEVPCIVSALSDLDAGEVQVIENLQRSDLHPLEEAAAYKQLMVRVGNAKDLAVHVGKSENYVRQRLQLANLIEPLQKSFRAGKLSASVAFLLARQTAEHQGELRNWINENGRYRDITAGYIGNHIEQKYHLKLAKAPFDTTDANLYPEAGPCTTCPKRTGNNAALFGDVKEDDTCTDSSCYEQKARNLVKVAVGQHPKAVVISGGHDYGTKLIGTEVWMPAGKKPCKDVVEGVVAQTAPEYRGSAQAKAASKLGAVIEICPNKKCKVHWNSANGYYGEDSGRNERGNLTKTPAQKAAIKKKRADSVIDQQVYWSVVRALRNNSSLVKDEDLRAVVVSIMEPYNFYHHGIMLAQGFDLEPVGDTPSKKGRHAVELLSKFMEKASRADMLAFIVAYPLTPYWNGSDTDCKNVIKAAPRFGVKRAAIAKSIEQELANKPKKGVCRVCKCDEKHACRVRTIPGSKQTQPCGWADKTKTLCTNPTCLAAAKKAA
jgi:ParB/RepB/Spo0J family partition protein